MQTFFLKSVLTVIQFCSVTDDDSYTKAWKFCFLHFFLQLSDHHIHQFLYGNCFTYYHSVLEALLRHYVPIPLQSLSLLYHTNFLIFCTSFSTFLFFLMQWTQSKNVRTAPLITFRNPNNERTGKNKKRIINKKWNSFSGRKEKRKY